MKLTTFVRHYSLRILVVSISLALTFTLASYQFFSASHDQISIIKRLDYLFYDWRFGLFLDNERFPRSNANIVIIDIDEKSLKNEGRWPWSRDRLAILIEQLVNAGTVVIGFDILMTEPQLNPTIQLQEKARYAERLDLVAMLEDFKIATDFDAILANSFSTVDVVTPYLFHDNADIQVGELPPPILVLEPNRANNLVAVTAQGYTATVPILQQAAIGSGFIVPSIDSDGSLRSAPILQRYENGLYPAFALAVGMAYYFLDSVDIEFEPFASREQISRIRFTENVIATDFAGRILIPYLGPQGQFPTFSATDIIEGIFDPQLLENAIVLIGTSSVGLADLRVTPVGTQYPGVEVHANILNALLVGDFPYEPEFSNWLTGILLLLLGTLFTLFSKRFGPFALMLATLTLMFTLLGFNLYFWLVQNAALPFASSFLLTMGLGTLHLLEGFLTERRAKQHVTHIFGQYVPAAHIDEMLNTPEDYGFEGESREMTVLFADIRDFTSLSETLNASELKILLNRYFTPITEVIFKHNGTIDKYVGDMVMAFWGAPITDTQHSAHALSASLDMLMALKKINNSFKKIGYPELAIGIGINTGIMNVGDMGSNFRRAYTVLGDAVNLASRLESLTKYYGIDILVGPETRRQCPSWTFRFVDRIRVKGKLQPVDIYEPIAETTALNKEQLAEVEAAVNAHNAYLKQHWAVAHELYEWLANHTDRAMLYRRYLDRIQVLSLHPPKSNWDGTFEHQHK